MTIQDWHKFAVKELGINPIEFWQLTFNELYSFIEDNQSTCISKDELKELVQKYPD
jgi:hypothetical protein